jgi:hypothetical protein
MGSEVRRVGDLEISQDLAMQRRIWTLQRIGWGVIALVLLVIMLGLTGRGPFSEATAGQAGSSLQVDYERFARHNAPAQLQIHVGPGVARNGKACIWLNQEYLESISIEQISPEALSTKVLSDRLVYEFELPDAKRLATITFETKPQKVGPLAGRVGLEDGRSLSFQQFVYP